MLVSLYMNVAKPVAKWLFWENCYSRGTHKVLYAIQDLMKDCSRDDNTCAVTAVQLNSQDYNSDYSVSVWLMKSDPVIQASVYGELKVRMCKLPLEFYFWYFYICYHTRKYIYIVTSAHLPNFLINITICYCVLLCMKMMHFKCCELTKKLFFSN